MREGRFTGSQILAILKGRPAGVSVAEILRKHGISRRMYRNGSQAATEDQFHLCSGHIAQPEEASMRHCGALHLVHCLWRLDVPVPPQTRLEGANVPMTWRPVDWLLLFASRQHFVQDSTPGRSAAAATGDALSASGTFRYGHASLGLYRSRVDSGANRSAYAAFGRTFTDWFGADLYVLQSRPRGGKLATTPVAILHERPWSRLGLEQLVSGSGRNIHWSVGGSYDGDAISVGVGHHVAYNPLDALHPFVNTLDLSLRIQVGDYRASLGTTRLATGQTMYVGSAATFLYLQGENGIGPDAVRVGIDNYVVRGIVEDEVVHPIEGAALSVGGAVAFADSQGRFFVRRASRRRTTIEVLVNDFLLPGTFSVVRIPESVTPAADAEATPLVIVLRRR